MSEGYWQSITRSRLSRRRALLGSAGLAAGGLALSLVGCGGGSDGSSSASGGRTIAVAKPVDSTSKARPGGVIKHFMTGEPAHFDALISANANVVNFVTPYAYPRLLKWQLGKYPDAADGVPEGYAAESYELSPDKLQLTFKLRQGMKWDSRAPTSGRQVDSQDVKYSWDKFGSINQLRTSLVYDAQKAPLAPVESLSMPDSKTVVMKLRQPDSRIISLLVAYDTFNIMPRESDGGFDPKNQVRGAGPWMLDEYTPSVRMVYKKNPDFYIKDRPLPDTVEIPFVADQAQRLAQFKAGNIYTSVVQSTNILEAKKDAPDTVIQQGSNFASAGGGYITFAWHDEKPWGDVRLRQAMSMAIDREAYADTIENRDAFRTEGIDLPIKYNSIVYAGWTGAYLDPTDDKAFGPTNKYLKYDLAEAKKLMAAAGASNLEFDWAYSTEQYGAEYLKSAQLFAGMFEAAGFKVKQVAVPYQTYQQKYSDVSYWDVTAVVMRAGRQWPSLAQNLFAFLHPSGSHYHGATPDGKNVDKGDPKLTDWILKIIGEFDVKKQNDTVHDLIRYYTQQSYSISRPSNSPGLTLTWPVLGNYGLNSTFVGGSAVDPWLNWWIDPSKPPLGKA
jgi:ABC-type transport system substrate-binding protein